MAKRADIQEFLRASMEPSSSEDGDQPVQREVE